jgi:hypothetical protein
MEKIKPNIKSKSQTLGENPRSPDRTPSCTSREFTETPEPTRHPEGKQTPSKSVSPAPRLRPSSYSAYRIKPEDCPEHDYNGYHGDRCRWCGSALYEDTEVPSVSTAFEMEESGYDDNCARCGIVGEPCSRHGGRDRSFV